MQIVINIPDEQIEKCLEESKYIHENEGEKGFVDITLLYTNKSLEFVDIVRKHDFYSLKANYKILPKGHGRLIDYGYVVDAIDDWVNAEEYRYTNTTDCLRNRIENVPTIIDADKEENEKYNCMACAHDGDNNICNECENGSKYLKWRTVYWEQAGNPDRLEEEVGESS